MAGTGQPWGESPAAVLALRILFLALICAALTQDVRRRRIPNALSLALAGGGLLFMAMTLPGWTGVWASIAGLAVGLVTWIVFYALGVMGAGDVKFFAAASAWLGPTLALRAAVLAALVGGVLATVALLRDGRLVRTLRGLVLLPFTRSLPTPRVVDLGPAAARSQLPYGVALGLGAALAFMFPKVICGA